MKPITALIILDGFGYREEKEYNAILTDGAVHFMQLWNTCPHPRKFAFSVMIGASYLTTLKDVIYVYDESGYYRKDANMSNVSLRFAIEW